MLAILHRPKQTLNRRFRAPDWYDYAMADVETAAAPTRYCARCRSNSPASATRCAGCQAVLRPLTKKRTSTRAKGAPPSEVRQPTSAKMLERAAVTDEV